MTAKIFYFEIVDHMTNLFGGKYFFYKSKPRNLMPNLIKHASVRIWEYDPITENIQYIKNRDTGALPKVDLKEFLLIQLKAEQITNETT
jgi:hypothetical protein